MMLAILILFVCLYFTDQKPIFEDVRVPLQKSFLKVFKYEN